MKTGLVNGEYLVLTKKQFEEVLEWKRTNKIRDVYFDVDLDYICPMNQYIKPYRHFHLGNIENPDEIISFGQDAGLLDGILHDYPTNVRREIVTSTILAEKVAISLVNEKRVNHILSVTKLATELAKSHSLDENKTRIAGLFHDCTKNWKIEDSLVLMNRYYPKASERHPNVYHQYTAEKYLHNYIGIYDRDILDAVRHHVDGDNRKRISQIIYLSDKLDPSRGYDSSKLVKLAKENLDLAVKTEREIQIEYLKKEGREVS